MKIAFIVDYFPKVSETFIANQVIGLMERGHQVTIFANRKPKEGDFHDIIKKHNLLENTVYFDDSESYLEGIKKLLDIPKLLNNSSINYLSGVDSLKQIPRKIAHLEKMNYFKDYDIIHAHFGPVGCNHIHLVEETDAKFIVSFYGHDVNDAQKNPSRYEDLFNKSDGITVLSEDMKSKIKAAGCEPEKIRKVPLGIDIEKFEYKPKKRNKEENPKVLTVARFTEKKGLRYAIEELSEIEKDFEYHLVGDGELREKIEKLVKENGIEEKVTFHGWMTNEEVKQKMQESDIFLLPSVTASDGDQEGTPTVLLEAQATRLPVVSTYHAGIPEIVKDGETGLLAEEKDIEGSKQNLESLIDNPDKRAKMGKKGRELIINSYSIEGVSQKLELLYKRLIDES